MAWADRSEVEQIALRYCAPRGIPLSVFRGRVVCPGDPAWLDGDFVAALEWQAYEDGKCPGCGQPASESMADEDDSPAYEAEALRCHACKVRSITEREASNDGDPGAGLYSIVRKVS